MPHDVAVQGLGGGILHALRQADHLGLLGDHVHDDIGGQALAAVVEPFDEIAVVQRGDADGAALIIDLGVIIGHLELADHVGQLAQLAVAQALSGLLIQHGDLVEGDLLHLGGKVAVFHREQVPIGGSSEDGHGDDSAQDGDHDEQEHQNADGQALGLDEAEILLDAAAGVHVEAGGNEGADHVDDAQYEEKAVKIAVMEVDRRQGDVKIEQAENEGDKNVDQDAGGFVFQAAAR